MKKEISNIKEINESIIDSDLFELRFNNDYLILTESINSISFGQHIPNIYLTITDFGHTIKPNSEGKLKVFDYDLNLDINNLKLIITEGFNLLLCDRQGNIKYNFEFCGCVLHDIAEQKLDYNLDNKFKTYIISIGYYKIFKVLEK